MNQSALTEENKKYKKISSPSKSNITNTDTNLLITNSIKRISNKPNEVIKTFDENSKASTEEILEQMSLATEEITNIFYDMELAILSDGAIPLIMGEKLHALKAMVFLCKIQLCMPELDEISFPESFTEEYSRLLERTDKAIEAIKVRVNKLKSIEVTELLVKAAEKNLLTLNMLHMHYISALGLPETNL